MNCKEKERLPNFFYTTSVSRMSQPDKDIERKENYELVFFIDIDIIDLIE